MFGLYTLLILLTAVAGVAWAVLWNRDTLHPLVFLLPASAYLYGFIPYTAEVGTLQQYFTTADLQFVQGLNFACVCALTVGSVVGSSSLRRDGQRVDVHTYTSTFAWQSVLFRLSLLIGGLGVLLYIYNLSNVGGFIEAYDSAKGGGRAPSGYLRDFTLLSLPAIFLLYLSRSRLRLWKDYLLLFAYSSPLLVHGLLSARRGPTFMGIAALAGGWYLTRHRRPKLPAVIGGGVAIGLLLLLLVTFRSQIYLGSSFFTDLSLSPDEAISQTIEQNTEVSAGNEFIYGAYAVLRTHRENSHHWGARYLTYIFVRPIPSFIWPDKYEDVGMESLLVNAGTLGNDVRPGTKITITEAPAGAAPGFAGDLYVEFAWGAVPAAFFLGWFFGFVWRRSLIRGGIWLIIHGCVLSLSLYFVTQTIEAFLFRFLVVTIPTALFWMYANQRYGLSLRVRPS